MTQQPLRFGVLGAARIAPQALIKPASRINEVEVIAVAARNAEKAQTFARKHGLARSYSRYEDLLADPDIDAVYIPLPNSLHGQWTIRALQAGKAVLCEKPGAANAEEAARVAQTVQETGQLMMEAYHWRYHALATRVRQLLDDGAVGNVQHVSMSMCFPLLSRNDIRWQRHLAGGALMDCCYTVNILRFLAAGEPTVVSAKSWLCGKQIDRRTIARLAFDNGVTGQLDASMLSRRLLSMEACVDGDAGQLRIVNPVLPQLYHRLILTTRKNRHREKVSGESSYAAQLRAFATAWRDGSQPPTSADDMVRNMSVIDAIYSRSGLLPRQPSEAN